MEDLEEFEMNALGSYEVPDDDGSVVAGYEETDFDGTDRDPTVSVNPGRGAARFRKRGTGEVYGTEETDFGGTDADINQVTDGLHLGRTVRQTEHYTDSHSRIIVGEDRMRQIRRRHAYRDTEDFFTNILDLEPGCNDPRFVDYLLDNDAFKITRELSDTGLVNDYSVKYLGGEFRSIGRALTDEESNTLRTGIREYYDEWQSKMLRRTMKRAGVLAGVGLSIVAVVTGLAVGLTRGGSDVIHAGKKRREWEKLNPSKASVIPWSDIEEAGGSALVFTGKYLTVILAMSAGYLIVSRKRK